jgi:hypothetical protein
MTPVGRAICLLFFSGLALLLSGCGNNPHNRQAVSGTVTYKGRPVETGRIEFSPLQGQATGEAAEIKDGKFAIAAKNGLSPGDYKVMVNAPQGGGKADPAAPGGDLGSPPTELIPPRYNAQSKLRATVEDGGRNFFEYDLK